METYVVILSFGSEAGQVFIYSNPASVAWPTSQPGGPLPSTILYLGATPPSPLSTSDPLTGIRSSALTLLLSYWLNTLANQHGLWLFMFITESYPSQAHGPSACCRLPVGLLSVQCVLTSTLQSQTRQRRNPLAPALLGGCGSYGVRGLLASPSSLMEPREGAKFCTDL